MSMIGSGVAGAPPAVLRRTVLRVLCAPFTRRAWRDTGFVVAGVPLALPALGSVLLIPLDVAGWGALAMLVVMLGVLGGLTRLQRDRFRSLLGLEIPATAGREGSWFGRGLLRWLRADTTWRQLGYHLLAAPLVSLGAVAVVVGWTASVVYGTVYAWYWLAPMGSVVNSGQNRGDFWLTVLGVLLAFAAPWAAALVVRLDTRAAAALLGPNLAKELRLRVESLAESRSEVVDAADAERRRIERDLHDGAQQRLVSMAMNLGLARRMLKNLPPEEQAARAMSVIDEAHLEAQAAIVELRELVRGLHPVVLEDRGLDAALSGIAARAPLPVRLTVELPRRAAPAVEAVAYFVVSEALTNIAKHARASRAEVDVRQNRSRLVITVTDDGVGGADPGKGTGLAGLRQRTASVDGALEIVSPLGGPTILTVELPCEL
jgi:signal transduction histidine kinase